MTRALQGRTGRAGGPDSLVEVGLGLLTLDGGREGVDGLVSAEHSGVPHGVVSLPRDTGSVSTAPETAPSPASHPSTENTTLHKPASTSSSPQPSPRSQRAAGASLRERMKSPMLQRSHGRELGGSQRGIHQSTASSAFPWDLPCLGRRGGCGGPARKGLSTCPGS